MVWADICTAFAICKRAFDAEYSCGGRSKSSLNLSNASTTLADADSASAPDDCKAPVVVAVASPEEQALEQQSMHRLRDAVWYTTLVWAAAEELLLHW
jgi:hypothetical protein